MASHLEESPRWVLVGLGEQTIAVLITDETVMVFLTTEDITEDVEPPTTISTSSLMEIADTPDNTREVRDRRRIKRPNPSPASLLQTAKRTRHYP